MTVEKDHHCDIGTTLEIEGEPMGYCHLKPGHRGVHKAEFRIEWVRDGTILEQGTILCKMTALRRRCPDLIAS